MSNVKYRDYFKQGKKKEKILKQYIYIMKTNIKEMKNALSCF